MMAHLEGFSAVDNSEVRARFNEKMEALERMRMQLIATGTELPSRRPREMEPQPLQAIHESFEIFKRRVGWQTEGGEPALNRKRTAVELRARQTWNDDEGRIVTVGISDARMQKDACRRRVGVDRDLPRENDPVSWRHCARPSCGMMCTGLRDHAFCCNRCRDDGAHGKLCKRITREAHQERILEMKVAPEASVPGDLLPTRAERWETRLEIRNLPQPEQVTAVSDALGCPNPPRVGQYTYIVGTDDGLEYPGVDSQGNILLFAMGDPFGPFDQLYVLWEDTTTGQPELCAETDGCRIELTHKIRHNLVSVHTPILRRPQYRNGGPYSCCGNRELGTNCKRDGYSCSSRHSTSCTTCGAVPWSKSCYPRYSRGAPVTAGSQE
jgi:hypothetical protein